METLNWLVEAITNQIAQALWAVIGQAILFAVLGLVGGIVLVVIAGRRKWMKRPNTAWSFLAGLNYVYIPILLMLLGGVMGGVHGAHSASGRFIDTASAPFIAYGEQYANHFQQYASSLSQISNVSLDEIIAEEASLRGGFAPGGYEFEIATMFNMAIIGAVLDEMGIPIEVRNPATIIESMRSTAVNAGYLNRLPIALHSYCDAFFWMKYQFFLLAFFPFLLVPIVEGVIYAAYRLSQGKSSKALAAYDSSELVA